MIPGYLPAGIRVPEPQPEEIHIWILPLEGDAAFSERCRAVLTQQELARAAHFKFENSRKNFLNSQGGLRLLLSAYINAAPEELEIGRRVKGKPFLEKYPDLHFNMSNSGKWAVYGISRSGEIGIDLECVRHLDDLDELIRQSFSEREVNYIMKIEEEKARRFFKFWTVKEAYLKAIGEGMRMPPEGLVFNINNGFFQLESVRGVQEQQDWKFSDFEADELHLGTIVHPVENVVLIRKNF